MLDFYMSVYLDALYLGRFQILKKLVQVLRKLDLEDWKYRGGGGENIIFKLNNNFQILLPSQSRSGSD